MNRHTLQPWVMALSLLAGMNTAHADAPQPQGGVNSQRVYTMSGVLNLGAMTTVVHCTNFGNTPASILTAFHNYDGTFVCAAGSTSVAPGHSVSMAILPVASLANLSTCASSGLIDQGMAYVVGDVTTNLHFKCSGQVIDQFSTPPASAVRLTIYTAAGVSLRDLIFADGFEQ